MTRIPDAEENVLAFAVPTDSQNASQSAGSNYRDSHTVGRLGQVCVRCKFPIVVSTLGVTLVWKDTLLWVLANWRIRIHNETMNAGIAAHSVREPPCPIQRRRS